MPDRMFETRSEAWAAAGLSVDFSDRTVRRARVETIVLMPLFIALLVFYAHRWDVLGSFGRHHHHVLRLPLEVVTVIVLLSVGWALARAVGRLTGPAVMRRMDPATAGSVGFVVRVIVVIIMVLVVFSVAGTGIKTLAVGGGFTAVVVGLAAQQTLGNAFAGIVLLSARPFRVGQRVRLQAGAMGGQIEGVVSSLGLLYTSLTQGTQKWMIPNNVVLAAVVVPLTEPDPIEVRVRLSHGVRPSQVQAILESEVGIPSRKSVLLEEVDGDDAIVRIRARPEIAADGTRLADEIMSVLASVTGEHEAAEYNNARDGAARQRVD